jgi:hypothetical protein
VSEENMANQLEEMSVKLHKMSEKMRMLAEVSPHNGPSWRSNNRAYVNTYTRNWARAAAAVKAACGVPIPLLQVRTAITDSRLLAAGHTVIVKDHARLPISWTEDQMRKAVAAYYETDDYKNRQKKSVTENALDDAIMAATEATDAIKAREVGTNNNEFN